MTNATVLVEDDVIQSTVYFVRGVTTRLCKGCGEMFAPKVKTQLFCNFGCKKLLKPVGRRAAYPMVSCIFPGCKSEPFQKMRPDHRFCSPVHRATYHAARREEAIQKELTELRSENERLRKEVDRYAKPIQKKAS